MARKKTMGLASFDAHKTANTHADAVDPDAAPGGWRHDAHVLVALPHAAEGTKP